MDLKCNGDKNCVDGSDEIFCECLREEFKCKQSQKCIDVRQLCNGVQDCADGSDEQFCRKCIFFNLLVDFPQFCRKLLVDIVHVQQQLHAAINVNSFRLSSFQKAFIIYRASFKRLVSGINPPLLNI